MTWTSAEFAEFQRAMRMHDYNAVANVVDTMVHRRISGLKGNVDELAKSLVALQLARFTQFTTRALDTDFTVDAARDASVAYSIKLPTKLLLIGSDEATVALFCNATEIARVSNKVILGVGLSINDERDPIKLLQGIIPAGSTVQITTIAASNTAAAPSIVNSMETLL